MQLKGHKVSYLPPIECLELVSTPFQTFFCVPYLAFFGFPLLGHFQKKKKKENMCSFS